MHDYKKLEVWQESMELIMEVYKATSNFPDKEKFGLIIQINRSAVSIPSNIAEGAGRNTKGEFRNFLGNACGSICELETQLIIANNLGYLPIVNFQALITRLKGIQKMTFNLIKHLGK